MVFFKDSESRKKERLSTIKCKNYIEVNKIIKKLQEKDNEVINYILFKKAKGKEILDEEFNDVYKKFKEKKNLSTLDKYILLKDMSQYFLRNSLCFELKCELLI